MEMKLDKEATEAILLRWALANVGPHFNAVRIEYYGDAVFSCAEITPPVITPIGDTPQRGPDDLPF